MNAASQRSRRTHLQRDSGLFDLARLLLISLDTGLAKRLEPCVDCGCESLTRRRRLG